MFYTVKNGKVDKIQSAPTGKDNWTKAPDTWGGYHGMPVTYIGDDGQVMGERELIEKGVRVDFRGVWYNTVDKSQKRIDQIDVMSGENYTKPPPLPNEPYQLFDGDKWVIDTVEKDKAEKDAKIAKIQADIDDAERRIQRSTRAKLAGTATEEDEAFFDAISAEIDKLRDEKRTLLSG